MLSRSMHSHPGVLNRDLLRLHTPYCLSQGNRVVPDSEVFLREGGKLIKPSRPFQSSQPRISAITAYFSYTRTVFETST